MNIPQYLPQWLYLSYLLVYLGVKLGKHGQVVTQEYNIYNIFKSTLLSGATIGVLFWGGFFNYVGIPQLVYIGISLLGLGLLISKNGTQETETVSFWAGLFAGGLLIWIISSGGFFLGMF